MSFTQGLEKVKIYRLNLAELNERLDEPMTEDDVWDWTEKLEELVLA